LNCHWPWFSQSVARNAGIQDRIAPWKQSRSAGLNSNAKLTPRFLFDTHCCSGNCRKVDYATETKYFASPERFLPRRLIGLRRRRKIGNPDMKLVTTCHAERTNLSVRTFTRRFTRCTLSYSKKLEKLKHAVALFVWHFDFCRVHSAHGKTPAQAAGLTEKVFTIAELLESAN